MSSIFSNWHIIADRKGSNGDIPPAKRNLTLYRVGNPRYRYLAVPVLVALATLLDAPFHTHIAPTNLAMLYLVAVVISAAYLGRGPAILASVLGVLAYDFFFVPPYLTFRVTDSEYLITFAALLGVGLIISELTVRAHEQAEAAHQRELETAAMYALSRDLVDADTIQAIAQITSRHIQQVFGVESSIVINEEGDIEPYSQPQEERLPWHLPLCASQGTLGVLKIQPGSLEAVYTPTQTRLLEAFADLAAQAIERIRLAEHARQAQILQETERLQTALLNSISNDLRTPLVTITGSLSTLREESVALDAELRGDLVETAYQESGRLNRLVANLLNMTRLEAGAMKVNQQPEDVQDLIGAALEPLNERLEKRPVQIQLQPGMPLVPMDFSLMENVLVNVIDNAIQYSPDGSPLEILAFFDEQNVEIRVEDRGAGISSQDLERVFDKFSRVDRPTHGLRSGTGLGLSICRGIVEAHGGSIWAENRPGGGTVIRLMLPLKGTSKGR